MNGTWCAPDAVSLMPTLTGCSSVAWSDAVADLLPRPPPVTYINVRAETTPRCAARNALRGTPSRR